MDVRGSKGMLYSVDPPTKYLTFGGWIYMVPQYRPESVLMLGYAGGTTAALIRMLYGDVPITAVDWAGCEPLHGETMVREDARRYIKTCGPFDSVIVDLMTDEDDALFVFEKEFADDLARCSNYVILHGTNLQDVSAYSEHFDFVMSLQLFGSRFFYFKRRGADLPELTHPF